MLPKRGNSGIYEEHRNFCKILDKGPPDSMVDIRCPCGFKGIMLVDKQSARKTLSAIEYSIVCPNCERRQPFKFFRAPWYFLVRRIKFAKALVIALGLSSILLGIAFVNSPRSKAIGVLLENGPNAAIEWLKNPLSSQELFAKAWGLYSKGEYQAAREIASKVVKRNVSEKATADSYYLLALMDNGQTEDGFDYYHKAISLYAKGANLNSQFLTMVGLADTLVAKGEIESAQDTLFAAMEIGAGSPNLAYYYEVQGYLDIWTGDFPRARENTLLALDMYEFSDINGVARTLSTDGFLLILMGEKEAGILATVQAETIIAEIGAFRLWVYTQINHLAALRLECNSGAAYIALFEEHLEKHNDRRLQRYFDFAKGLSCSMSEKVGDSTSPPPPPD